MPTLQPSANPAGMLRDIHLPDAVSWWPPAIGWWILLVIVISIIIFLPRLYRRVTYIPLNKIALQSFENIIASYNNSNNPVELITATSKLLRQVAMSYHPREEVACLTGEEWIDLLNTMTSEPIFNQEIKELLMNAPYQEYAQINSEQFINNMTNWFQGLPKKPGEQHA